MKYKAEVVAYESYGEVYLGNFEVEADNEEEADMAARCAAKKRHPNLEDFEVMKLEAIVRSFASGKRLFANSVEKNIRPKD